MDLPACHGFSPFDTEEGSGVPETTVIETGTFDEIASGIEHN